MRLLAVDDDPVVLDLLPVVFTQAGLPDLNLASSAEAALDILSDPDNIYDCLMFDIQMVEMDGVELVRRVRKFAHHRDTPVLMLTSVTDHSQIEQAFAAGANDYITKPFDVKEITTRVRVAQRMIASAGPAPLLDPRATTGHASAGVHPFDIGDPVRIQGAEHLILPFSLGNYLSQLSRRRLDTCSIFAIKAEDIGALYANSKSHEFARGLAEIVNAVNTVVNSPSLLMSYEGDGMFLSITQDETSLRWPEIEDDVMAVLAERAPAYDDGTPLPLEVSIGNPIAPNASRTQRVKKTFDRAMDRALMREKTKVKKAPRTPFSTHPGPHTFHIN